MSRGQACQNVKVCVEGFSIAGLEAQFGELQEGVEGYAVVGANDSVAKESFYLLVVLPGCLTAMRKSVSIISQARLGKDVDQEE
jgi:hypothetical protein